MTAVEARATRRRGLLLPALIVLAGCAGPTVVGQPPALLAITPPGPAATEVVPGPACARAQQAASELLRRALTVREEALARNLSEQAIRSVATSCTADEAGDLRRRYDEGRVKCQMDGACMTFGEPPRGDGRGQADADPAIDRLCDEGRFREAVQLAGRRAAAGAYRDPGATAGRYLGRAGRILLMELGDATTARRVLEPAARTLEALLASSAKSGGVGFIDSYHLDRSEVAAVERTLALARFAEGDATGGRAAYQRALSLGALPGPNAPASDDVLREQATLEMLAGNCPDALALWKRRVAALEALPLPDGRRLDARLELATASIVCGAPGAERSFEEAAREHETLLLDGGESSGWNDAGFAQRRLDTLLTYALAEPADGRRAQMALEAVLAVKGNVLAAQRNALLGTDTNALRPVAMALAEPYRLLSRYGLKAIASQARDPHADESWSEDPWRWRRRAGALERQRNALRKVAAPALAGAAARLQTLVPPGRVLVEYVRYRPYDFRLAEQPRRWGAPRYAAFVIARGRPLRLQDLGEAAAVDVRVHALAEGIGDCARCPARGLVRRADNVDAGTTLRELYDLILRPLRGAMESARYVYISADAALGRVPFAALAPAPNRYLLDEGFTFHYLISASDFERSPNPSPSASLFVLAGPELGPPSSESGLQSLAPLPSTLQEAADILSLWNAQGPRGAVVETHLGDDATKGALLSVRAHGIIHIATHGWYIPVAGDAPDVAATPGRAFHPARPPSLAPPLIRAGLALRGANVTMDNEATALELSRLDLRATQLVVLSACETGQGEIIEGEGLAGLSRAFLSDGAETVVSSLWNVPDVSTRTLMRAYYGRLLRGEDRVGALHEAARELRRQDGTADPWFWAAFVAHGQGGPLRLPAR